MIISKVFPVYDKLTDAEKETLDNSIMRTSVPNNTIIHRGADDCSGFIIVKEGQLRAFITSEDGHEITLYRLLDGDACLFSASCMMKNIQFDIMISAEKDTELYVIPADVYQKLTDTSLPVAKFTNELMSSRMSEVMWLVEQIMWKSMDKRVADFLIKESNLEQSLMLNITHEQIANHLGTAREVVTRMLKYLQSEGLVQLSRGAVTIVDEKGLIDITT